MIDSYIADLGMFSKGHILMEFKNQVGETSHDDFIINHWGSYDKILPFMVMLTSKNVDFPSLPEGI